MPKDIVYCTKCGDSNLKAVDLKADKVDYYAGSPPFEKERKDPDWGF